MTNIEFIQDLLHREPWLTDDEIAETYGEEIGKLPGILLGLYGLIWSARKRNAQVTT